MIEMQAESMQESSVESTNKLLRVIVALLLRGRDEQALTLKQQIGILNELGLRPTEIASILGKKSSYINKELTGLRKEQRRE